MSRSEEKEPAFKVVDRRRVDEQGEIRPQQQTENSIPKEQEAQTKAPKETPPFEQEGQKEDKSEPWARERHPINFSIFCQSLAHQAMMGLGLIPWPDSGLVQARPEVAKETIDILELLQKKTKGNLDAEEKALIDTLLYQLRMTFVQMTTPTIPPTGGPGHLKVP